MFWEVGVFWWAVKGTGWDLLKRCIVQFILIMFRVLFNKQFRLYLVRKLKESVINNIA